MLRLLRITAAGIFSFVLMASQQPAMAQEVEGPFCGDHTSITAQLGKRYLEKRVGIGLLDDGRMVEIFASSSIKSTWSLLVTIPGGVTCLVASGEAWTIPPVGIDTLILGQGDGPY